MKTEPGGIYGNLIREAPADEPEKVDFEITA